MKTLSFLTLLFFCTYSYGQADNSINETNRTVDSINSIQYLLKYDTTLTSKLSRFPASYSYFYDKSLNLLKASHFIYFDSLNNITSTIYYKDHRILRMDSKISTGSQNSEIKYIKSYWQGNEIKNIIGDKNIGVLGQNELIILAMDTDYLWQNISGKTPIKLN